MSSYSSSSSSPYSDPKKEAAVFARYFYRYIERPDRRVIDANGQDTDVKDGYVDVYTDDQASLLHRSWISIDEAPDIGFAIRQFLSASHTHENLLFREINAMSGCLSKSIMQLEIAQAIELTTNPSFLSHPLLLEPLMRLLGPATRRESAEAVVAENYIPYLRANLQTATVSEGKDLETELVLDEKEKNKMRGYTNVFEFINFDRTTDFSESVLVALFRRCESHSMSLKIGQTRHVAFFVAAGTANASSFRSFLEKIAKKDAFASGTVLSLLEYGRPYTRTAKGNDDNATLLFLLSFRVRFVHVPVPDGLLLNSFQTNFFTLAQQYELRRNVSADGIAQFMLGFHKQTPQPTDNKELVDAIGDPQQLSSRVEYLASRRPQTHDDLEVKRPAVMYSLNKRFPVTHPPSWLAPYTRQRLQTEKTFDERSAADFLKRQFVMFLTGKHYKFAWKPEIQKELYGDALPEEHTLCSVRSSREGRVYRLFMGDQSHGPFRISEHHFLTESFSKSVAEVEDYNSDQLNHYLLPSSANGKLRLTKQDNRWLDMATEKAFLKATESIPRPLDRNAWADYEFAIDLRKEVIEHNAYRSIRHVVARHVSVYMDLDRQTDYPDSCAAVFDPKRRAKQKFSNISLRNQKRMIRKLGGAALLDAAEKVDEKKARAIASALTTTLRRTDKLDEQQRRMMEQVLRGNPHTLSKCIGLATVQTRKEYLVGFTLPYLTFPGQERGGESEHAAEACAREITKLVQGGAPPLPPSVHTEINPFEDDLLTASVWSVRLLDELVQSLFEIYLLEKDSTAEGKEIVPRYCKENKIPLADFRSHGSVVQRVQEFEEAYTFFTGTKLGEPFPEKNSRNWILARATALFDLQSNALQNILLCVNPVLRSDRSPLKENKDAESTQKVFRFKESLDKKPGFRYDPNHHPLEPEEIQKHPPPPRLPARRQPERKTESVVGPHAIFVDPAAARKFTALRLPLPLLQTETPRSLLSDLNTVRLYTSANRAWRELEPFNKAEVCKSIRDARFPNLKGEDPLDSTATLFRVLHNKTLSRPALAKAVRFERTLGFLQSAVTGAATAFGPRYLHYVSRRKELRRHISRIRHLKNPDHPSLERKEAKDRDIRRTPVQIFRLVVPGRPAHQLSQTLEELAQDELPKEAPPTLPLQHLFVMRNGLQFSIEHWRKVLVDDTGNSFQYEWWDGQAFQSFSGFRPRVFKQVDIPISEEKRSQLPSGGRLRQTEKKEREEKRRIEQEQKEARQSRPLSPEERKALYYFEQEKRLRGLAEAQAKTQKQKHNGSDRPKRFDWDNHDQTVHLAMGETFSVRLHIGDSGYVWQLKPEGIPPQLELVKKDIRAFEQIGAGGEVTYTFRATAKGNGVLKITESRPWEKTGSCDAFVLHVNVVDKPTTSGASCRRSSGRRRYYMHR